MRNPFIHERLDVAQDFLFGPAGGSGQLFELNIFRFSDRGAILSVAVDEFRLTAALHKQMCRSRRDERTRQKTERDAKPAAAYDQAHRVGEHRREREQKTDTARDDLADAVALGDVLLEKERLCSGKLSPLFLSGLRTCTRRSSSVCLSSHT